jgi:opacity protein-like surface antigen
MKTILAYSVLFALLLVTAKPTQAKAEFDIEVDPIAYILRGYSVHGGLILNDRFRFDLGTFGAEIPEFFHETPDVDISVPWGIGIKADYLFRGYEGAFIGLESGISEVSYSSQISTDQAQQTAWMYGIRGGYRFVIGTHFTITPWIGVGHSLSSPTSANLDGKDVSLSPWTVFPTVHCGWKF